LRGPTSARIRAPEKRETKTTPPSKAAVESRRFRSPNGPWRAPSRRSMANDKDERQSAKEANCRRTQTRKWRNGWMIDCVKTTGCRTKRTTRDRPRTDPMNEENAACKTRWVCIVLDVSPLCFSLSPNLLDAAPCVEHIFVYIAISRRHNRPTDHSDRQQLLG
jgi:hypothetical protein